MRKNIDRHARQTQKCNQLMERYIYIYIYAINTDKNERVPLISELVWDIFVYFSIHERPYVPNVVNSAGREDTYNLVLH